MNLFPTNQANKPSSFASGGIIAKALWTQLNSSSGHLRPPGLSLPTSAHAEGGCSGAEPEVRVLPGILPGFQQLVALVFPGSAQKHQRRTHTETRKVRFGFRRSLREPRLTSQNAFRREGPIRTHVMSQSRSGSVGVAVQGRKTPKKGGDSGRLEPINSQQPPPTQTPPDPLK